MSLTILHPPTWPRPRGYANGTAGTGRVVTTGGMIGWDAEGRFADGLVAQIGQTLHNVLAVLAEAGAGPADVARMTWYVTDMGAYRRLAYHHGPPLSRHGRRRRHYAGRTGGVGGN